MRRLVALTLLLTVSALSPAQQSDRQDKPHPGADVFNPNPLPKHLTPEELRLPLPQPARGDRTPPTGTVYCPAEYEAMDGLIIAWEGYTDVLTDMVVPATTNDPNITMWVVVDSSSEQTSAFNTLNAAGADMSQVDFIVRTTDTVWIRDYGPRYIFEDGTRAIIDHTYNRPRPNDNALNDHLTTLWGHPQYDIPLTHGGGNFHLFSNGDAFMTDLILTENSGLTEQDVVDLYADYQNLNLTIYPGFPTSFDSTQHIDMWMLPAGDNNVIIGDYNTDHPTHQANTISNDAAADMAARGYTVHRVRGWNSGGTHYTYTNAVVLNDQVFMPSFGGSYASRDATALAVFQTAFPSHTIHQVDCSSIIHAAGAVHCIVMHIPDEAPGPEPVAHVTVPNGDELWVVNQPYYIEWNAFDDVGVTSVDILLSTDGGANFDHTIATGIPNTGYHPWTVPDELSNQCRVKVIAYDGDGNSGEDMSDGDFTIAHTGPQVIYDFPLDSDPGWTTTGLWAWGVPTGGNQDPYGQPDPTSGHTGSNVYGYNLNGDYEPSLPPRDLTSAALDLTGVTDCRLEFWRWLGVESPSYDHAYLYISNDGSTWNMLWQNTATVDDGAWTFQEYDISAYADDQATVYLRWTMGLTDGSWNYCGWNIDDIQVIGIPAAPQICPGDANCDGQVDFGDINAFVAALVEGTYCDGTGDNADVLQDGSVGFEDINPFVELLTTNPLPITCP